MFSSGRSNLVRIAAACCILVLVAVACGEDAADTAPGTRQSEDGTVAIAEELLGFVYSGDLAATEEALASAEGGPDPVVVYLAGFMSGSGGEALSFACRETGATDVATCTAESTDEIAATLGIDRYRDTWTVTVADGAILRGSVALNVPPEWEAAETWIRENRSDLFEAGGPCDGWFDGGPTPEACGAAYAEAAVEYAAAMGG